MVQSVQDRSANHTLATWQPVTLSLECHRQCKYGLWNTRAKGHVGPSFIVMRHPLFRHYRI